VIKVISLLIKKSKISKLILCSIYIFIFQVHSVFAYNADQQKIEAAIEIIKNYGYKENVATLKGKNYTYKPVKIIFKDLTEINFAYSKFFAVTVTNDDGDLYILINNNLQNSDVRVLACLILHESNHCKENSLDSVTEEVNAHEQETALYLHLLEDDRNLQYKVEDRLIIRENRLKKIFDDALMSYISSNTSYVNYLKIKE
jgi:hypothetical protein